MKNITFLNAIHNVKNSILTPFTIKLGGLISLTDGLIIKQKKRIHRFI